MMKVTDHFCGLGWHKPGGQIVTNGGLSFSTCKKCGRDIIRKNAANWRAVPADMRVVWRAAEVDEMTFPVQRL